MRTSAVLEPRNGFPWAMLYAPALLVAATQAIATPDTPFSYDMALAFGSLAAFIAVALRFSVGGIRYLHDYANLDDPPKRRLPWELRHKNFVDGCVLTGQSILLLQLAQSVGNGPAFLLAYTQLLVTNVAWLLLQIFCVNRHAYFLLKDTPSASEVRRSRKLMGLNTRLIIWTANNLLFVLAALAYDDLLRFFEHQTSWALGAVALTWLNSIVDVVATRRYYSAPEHRLDEH